MIFLEPAETPYDLRFRTFGVYVRVHPMFWVLTVLLGWSLVGQDNGFQLLVLWVACVFVSILIHELGHVLVGRLFGADGHIVLYSFGGLAVGSNAEPYRWQRILVSLAGPGAQLLLWLLIDSVRRERLFTLPDIPLAWAALGFLHFINLWWAMLNLLPVWPLDGGRVARELCEALSPRDGGRYALGLSILVAGLIALNALAAESGRAFLPSPIPAGGMYTAILFGLLALNNFQEMQFRAAHAREDDRRWDWPDQDRRYWRDR